ncbi:hypothetical protein HDU93_008305 [Gonapodya sp. JEL0774]|nr:hypothetical protein HDU93_008305 [Gonapodya sp. JEL0774]
MSAPYSITSSSSRTPNIGRSEDRTPASPSLRGVKRISANIYDEIRQVLKDFLQRVLKPAVTYVEHRRGKTMTALDVVYALKLQATTLYGFDEQARKKIKR